MSGPTDRLRVVNGLLQYAEHALQEQLLAEAPGGLSGAGAQPCRQIAVFQQGAQVPGQAVQRAHRREQGVDAVQPDIARAGQVGQGQRQAKGGCVQRRYAEAWPSF